MLQQTIPAGSAGRFIGAVPARRDRCVMFRSKKTENQRMQRTALRRLWAWGVLSSLPLILCVLWLLAAPRLRVQRHNNETPLNLVA